MQQIKFSSSSIFSMFFFSKISTRVVMGPTECQLSVKFEAICQ